MGSQVQANSLRYPTDSVTSEDIRRFDKSGNYLDAKGKGVTRQCVALRKAPCCLPFL
ncbi:MAG: hypothetical protein MPJ50_15470 [Pirellulales bacterium]|nr:hypothetical protein [Pirellulales bacterium]